MQNIEKDVAGHLGKMTAVLRWSGYLFDNHPETSLVVAPCIAEANRALARIFQYLQAEIEREEQLWCHRFDEKILV